MRDVIPEPVFASISNHVVHAAEEAAGGWTAGSDEEDTLTGDLGANLRTDWSNPIRTTNGFWSWRIRYKKFRGRGRGAYEKGSGADGIVQVEATDGQATHIKGLLFQAKKVGRLDGRLAGQVERMEALATGGSSIFEYGPDQYRAVDGREYLREIESQQPQAVALVPLGDFLAKAFLGCTSGLLGMYFDAVRGLLLLPDGTAHHVSLAHRIGIEAMRIG